MAAQIIDGKAVAAEIRAEIAAKTLCLKERGIIPCLAVILVGTAPASVSYVTGKQKALSEAGMADRSFFLEETATEAELLTLIQKLNEDAAVHGILVQLPLPPHIDKEKALCAVAPDKDVDGFHPLNIGKLIGGQKTFVPCTVQGIAALLKKAGVQTDGKHIVIIGRSVIVGKPSALLFLQKEWNATVTVCHTGTKNLADFTRQADIVIAAAGAPDMVTGDMIKNGAAVIDVGVNRIADASKKSGFRLTGDVDFESVREKAAFITPVPGGVGPMTIAMLLENTLFAAERLTTELGA